MGGFAIICYGYLRIAFEMEWYGKALKRMGLGRLEMAA